MKRQLGKLKSGQVTLFGISCSWDIQREKIAKIQTGFDFTKFDQPYRLHIGPGPNWTKPNNQWIDVDIDPARGDMIVDFKDFESFPLGDNSTECIYGSHVFEHMSIWVTDKIFSECHRILKPGGVLRLVLPDAEKSIREYISGNTNFPLFQRRLERAKRNYGVDYTLFECMREDFLSRSGQQTLLGEKALAHQNAWDYKSIRKDLIQAGFAEVDRSALAKSCCSYFTFEGTYKCEALEEERSLYVEAVKK